MADPVDNNIENLSSAVRAGNISNVRKYIEFLSQSNGCVLARDAIKNNDSCILELLLQNGVSINGTENKSGLIFSAVEYNRPEIVEYLLNSHAAIDARNTNGFTPLHLAVFQGNERIVSLLLHNYANVNVKDNRHKTCIYTAVESSFINMRIISQLLEHSADVNCKYSGASLLHVAVSRLFIPLVELLLKKGARVDDVRFDGLTPLHIAAEKRSLPIVKMLLSRESNLNSYTSEKCCSPLHSAIKGGNHKIVKLFLEHGAKVDARNNSGTTALEAAVRKGRYDLVKQVLSHRPNKNDIYNSDVVCTALLGSSGDRASIVRDLVQYGFKASYHKFQNDSVKIFSEALQMNCVEVVDQFLKTGYDVNKLSQNKYYNFQVTPLHHAIESQCDAKIVKVLLDHKADISIKSKLGTPVMMAVQKSNPQYLRLLLKYRRTLQNDPSLLISAAYIGNTEIMEILLQNGSDVNGKTAPKPRPNPALQRCRLHRLLDCQVSVCIPTRDPHELNAGTALHMAVTRGHEDALNILLEYGADVNCETLNGLTPLRIAGEKRLWGIFETLLRFGAHVDLDSKFHRCPLSFAFEGGASQVFRASLAYNCTKSCTPSEEEGLGYQLRHIAIMEGFGPLSPSLQESREILMSHVARLKAANLLAEQVFVPPRLRDELENGEFVKRCIAEIARLKSVFLPVVDDKEELGPAKRRIAALKRVDYDCSAGASVYDALTGSAKRVARLAWNGAVMRFVNSDEFERRFPVYGSYVRIRLQKKDVRSEYMYRIQESSRLTPNRLSEVPFEVIEVILGCLSNQELKILMDIYAPARPYC